MTFGNAAWGSPDEEAESVFNAYIDAGGNLVDTADVYSGGRSEELVGAFTAKRKLRDRLALATKAGFSGGAGRKNLHRALEGSLRRLGTDYVDLYWLHVWDGVTPAEELVETMSALVRSGKTRYWGMSNAPAWLSDCPAWYATRVAGLAEARGLPGPIAMQLPYSLVDRAIEAEHLPAAHALGIAVTPWSPLAFGFLTGKHRRGPDGLARSDGGSRLDANTPQFQNFTDRQWATLEQVRAIAAEAGLPMAELALAWVLGRPGVYATILGARTVAQLEANLKSLTTELAPEHRARLDALDGPVPGSFYHLFTPAVQRGIFGGSTVEPWV